jgi:hypothetical protein
MNIHCLNLSFSIICDLKKSVSVFILVFVLTACGGGGASEAPSAPQNPSPTPAVDTDADGVIDTSDVCPNTAANAVVNASGCAAAQLDADSDGVQDSLDLCPNTSANQAVDVNGCASAQLDDDSDGVNNSVDQCAATPDGETVDSAGCGVVTQGGASANDTDADSVLNDVDTCPLTPRNELVDSVGCSQSQLDNDNDGVFNDIDLCDSTPSGEPIDTRGCGTTTETSVLSSAFVEQNGLLVVELENTNFSGNWEVEHGELSTNNGYLVYKGSDNFSTPNIDTITIPVVINNPGVYRFQWRNIISEGDSPTEANDSWLKIESNNFFAKKISAAQGTEPVGHIVCPNGRDASNRCEGSRPDGSTRLGWFKAYRNGGPVNGWVWRVSTSDFDPHAIFAEFDAPGQYNILVSGRSFGHGIDRLVMYKSDNSSGNLTEEFATDIDLVESARQ